MERFLKSFAFDNISYIDVEDNGEGKLYGLSVDYVKTIKFSEEIYDEWEDLLNSIDVIKPNFQIYCSWDSSGYKFWQNMNESNHTYIDVWVSDNFSDNDFKSLYEEIEKVIDKINNFLNKYNLL
jgi:hypothetical protein